MGRTEPAAGSELQSFASFWNKMITALAEDPSSPSATRDASCGRLQRQESGSGRSRKEQEGRAGVQGRAHGRVAARARAGVLWPRLTNKHRSHTELGLGPPGPTPPPATPRGSGEGVGGLMPVVVPRGPPRQEAEGQRQPGRCRHTQPPARPVTPLGHWVPPSPHGPGRLRPAAPQPPPRTRRGRRR